MLKIENLTAGYTNPVVTDLSLEVRKNQIVSLMGRNGVGKTTLMKTIMGILEPTEGSIFWKDEEITQISSHRRAQQGIGYVPQGRDIFPYLSVRENLLMGFESRNPDSDPSDVDQMLEIFPILEEKIEDAAGTLSGGQQQQLAIARILVGRPDILLLDEPAAGIQPSIVKKIGEVIERLNDERGLTVLLVEQFVDFALGLSDYVYVMREGEIVASESSDTIERDQIERHLSV